MAIDLTYSCVLNVPIGPPLNIYIYIYMARPIATFMNAAIDLPYSRVLKARLKPLINVAIGLLIATF